MSKKPKAIFTKLYVRFVKYKCFVKPYEHSKLALTMLWLRNVFNVYHHYSIMLALKLALKSGPKLE